MNTTETTHTPGPWKAAGRTIYRANSDRYIGLAYSTWDVEEGTIRCDEEDVPEDQEAMANADLIAAAPELLEACRALLNNPDMDEVVALAESAIAKAEGGEQA